MSALATLARKNLLANLLQTLISDRAFNVTIVDVWCNFLPGYTFRITVIFGTLKDGSLQINSLALNDCFS